VLRQTFDITSIHEPCSTSKWHELMSSVIPVQFLGHQLEWRLWHSLETPYWCHGFHLTNQMELLSSTQFTWCKEVGLRYRKTVVQVTGSHIL